MARVTIALAALALLGACSAPPPPASDAPSRDAEAATTYTRFEVRLQVPVGKRALGSRRLVYTKRVDAPSTDEPQDRERRNPAFRHGLQ